MASLALALAVVGTQSRAPTDPASPGGVAALPTPFGVPTQSLAFVAITAEGVAVYQTTVDRVCPPAAIDCAEVPASQHRVFAAPGEATAVSLDLHQANGRLALLTIDDLGHDTVSVVTLPRLSEPIPPFVGPLRSDGPPVASPWVPASAAPSATGPGGEASPQEPSGPVTSADPTPSDGASPGVVGGASVAPSATGGPSTGPVTTATTAGSPSSEGHAGASGTAADAPSLVSPPASPVPAEVQAVMEDVNVVGALPAWSADGDMLAFSAMPADDSGGPDLYVWRHGETRAQRLTDDGRSYFASWSGNRVVISRPETSDTDGSGVRARIVVIDPATDLERTAAVDGDWLPAVDPSGRLAVAWQGELTTDGHAVVPVRGELVLIDWGAIDPFAVARGDSSSGPPEIHDGSRASGAPDTGPGAFPGTTAGTASPTATTGLSRSGGSATAALREPAQGERRERRGRRQAASPTASPPSSAASPASAVVPPAPSTLPSDPGRWASASASPWSGPGADPTTRGVAVEPDRDVRFRPVMDWQVRWVEDSSAFGFWVTETPGAAWGELAVLAVDAEGPSIDHGTELLAPTLARRSFTLGLDRVAWVAPSEDRPDGELRLRTWGAPGHGSLRIRAFDVSTGLPAF